MFTIKDGTLTKKNMKLTNNAGLYWAPISFPLFPLTFRLNICLLSSSPGRLRISNACDLLLSYFTFKKSRNFFILGLRRQ